jgi:hypothetical protein
VKSGQRRCAKNRAYFSENRGMVTRVTENGADAANQLPVPAKINRRNTVLMELAAKSPIFR